MANKTINQLRDEVGLEPIEGGQLYLDPSLVAVLDTVIKESVDAATQLICSYKTVNEVRQDFGLAPLDNGDVVIGPKGWKE